MGRVIGHVRNRENRRQQHHENRSAHVATIGALYERMSLKASQNQLEPENDQQRIVRENHQAS